MCMFVRSMYVRWVVYMYPAHGPRSDSSVGSRLPSESVRSMYDMDADADTDGLDRNDDDRAMHIAICRLKGWALG